MKRSYRRRCGALYWAGLGEERKCNTIATQYFDRGKKGGYPVCGACAAHIHPRRLSSLHSPKGGR